MAKSLRSRLGLPPACPASRNISGSHRAPPPTKQEEDEDKEIWASIADLA